MGQFVEQYPIIASLGGFLIAILAGAIDLVVLKNRVLAIVFWLWGFPLTVTPIFLKESWGDIRWFLGAAIAILYVISVVAIYRLLTPERSERPLSADEDQ